jgi:decaprenylphospho-beta-D-erythro-pentofuranosid-2-ulose 2-reductase
MVLLVLGANSDVAKAVARKFAKEEKASLYLASRDMGILQKRAQDITTRYQVEAEPLYFDATDYASHAAFYESVNPKPDGVVVAFGYLGDQQQAQSDFQEARKIIETNFLGAVSILEIVAADFEKRGHGFIIGISSVAGERGRQSNYVYGSAKGAFTTYLSGLRNRLYKRNVRVITVLPGFVKTKMTDHLDLPQFLAASPEQVGNDVYRSHTAGKDRIYTKSIWKYIVFVLKAIPEIIFKRTNL